MEVSLIRNTLIKDLITLMEQTLQTGPKRITLMTPSGLAQNLAHQSFSVWVGRGLHSMDLLFRYVVPPVSMSIKSPTVIAMGTQASVHCNNAVEWLQDNKAIMFAVQHR